MTKNIFSFVFQKLNSLELGKFLKEAKITERDSMVEKSVLKKQQENEVLDFQFSPSAKTEQYFSWA